MCARCYTASYAQFLFLAYFARLSLRILQTLRISPYRQKQGAQGTPFIVYSITL